MPWFRVDDGFHSHPKAIAAGNAALGLWTVCGSWSSFHHQNGYVPTAVARQYGTAAQAKKLVDAGLWSEVDGGYEFHEWEERNPASDQAQRISEARRVAGSKGGKASAQARAARSKPEANGQANASQANGAIASAANEVPVPVPVPSLVKSDGPLNSGDARDPKRDHHEDQETAEQLAAVAHRLRPDWRLAGIRKAITDAHTKSGSLTRTTAALLAVAVAEDSKAPRRILSDGWWWCETDSRYLAALEDPKLTAALEQAAPP